MGSSPVNKKWWFVINLHLIRHDGVLVVVKFALFVNSLDFSIKFIFLVLIIVLKRVLNQNRIFISAEGIISVGSRVVTYPNVVVILSHSRIALIWRTEISSTRLLCYDKSMLVIRVAGI